MIDKCTSAIVIRCKTLPLGIYMFPGYQLPLSTHPSLGPLSAQETAGLTAPLLSGGWVVFYSSYKIKSAIFGCSNLSSK